MHGQCAHGASGTNVERLLWSIGCKGSWIFTDADAPQLLCKGQIFNVPCYAMHNQTILVSCRQAMCRCTRGAPVSMAQRGDDFQRNAKLTSQMWQNQGQLFAPSAQPSVDIPAPQLLRKSVAEPSPGPATPRVPLHLAFISADSAPFSILAQVGCLPT